MVFLPLMKLGATRFEFFHQSNQQVLNGFLKWQRDQELSKELSLQMEVPSKRPPRLYLNE